MSLPVVVRVTDLVVCLPPTTAPPTMAPTTTRAPTAAPTIVSQAHVYCVINVLYAEAGDCTQAPLERSAVSQAAYTWTCHRGRLTSLHSHSVLHGRQPRTPAPTPPTKVRGQVDAPAASSTISQLPAVCGMSPLVVLSRREARISDTMSSRPAAAIFGSDRQPCPAACSRRRHSRLPRPPRPRRSATSRRPLRL